MEEVMKEGESEVRGTKRWRKDSAQERDGYPAPENKNGERPIISCKCGWRLLTGKAARKRCVSGARFMTSLPLTRFQFRDREDAVKALSSQPIGT